MSRFLKFIVNLFLIAAILIAAAVIVPPLLGVRTTIIDSPHIETNLPMGSVTYSKDEFVTDIAQGDVVLKEDDKSSYVYSIETTDTQTGSFTVRDARDTSAETKTLQILNNIPKVIFTIPFIGYVVYAMHSTEGLIIIFLVVLLMIILFILSELWRNDDDDDDEDDDEDEDEDDDDYDDKNLIIPETEAYDLQKAVNIRPYMEPESEPAVESAQPAEAEYAKPVRAQVEEVSETEAKAEDDKSATIEILTDEEIEAVSATDEEAAAEEAKAMAEAEATAEAETAAEAAEVAETESTAEAAVAATVANETTKDKAVEVKEEKAPEAETAEAEVAKAEVPEAEAVKAEESRAGEINIEEIAEEYRSNEVSSEDYEEEVAAIEEPKNVDYDQLEENIEAILDKPEEAQEDFDKEDSVDFDGDDYEGETLPEDAEALAARFEESLNEDLDDEFEIVEEEKLEGEFEEDFEEEYDSWDDIEEELDVDDSKYEESFLEPADEVEEVSDTFIPVNRPTLEELLKDVSEYGVDPEVREDNVTGVSVVDYTNII